MLFVSEPKKKHSILASLWWQTAPEFAVGFVGEKWGYVNSVIEWGRSAKRCNRWPCNVFVTMPP